MNWNVNISHRRNHNTKQEIFYEKRENIQWENEGFKWINELMELKSKGWVILVTTLISYIVFYNLFIFNFKI